MIYSVTFHRYPRRKVYTYRFTDKDKAAGFYKSVKINPKVIDAAFICIPECEAESYDNTLIEPGIVPADHIDRK